VADTLERDDPKARGRELLLDHLERRRGGIEQAQWQAPALTVAAQAFLLPVLTNRDIDGWARFVILLAGVVAVLAALASLLRLRSREIFFSEVFAYYSDELMPDIRASSEVPRKAPRSANGLDKHLQRWSDHFGPPYLAWCIALLLFAAADVVAFALTV
jgi:hypothetical protein